MVLTDEVNPVNQRYRTLSNRYKAAWTFHRFMLGLRKFFGGRELDDRTDDFRSLYQRLREVSGRFDDLDIARVVEKLSKIGGLLDGLIDDLDEQDRKISASLVRLFFQRVKTQDERILIDLIRFYLEAQRDRDWNPERADKVDFLLSRLGRGVVGSDGGGDRKRLHRMLDGISDYAKEGAGFDSQKVANRLKLIRAVASELEQVESFEELTERDLVSHYRNLKHGLGAMVFEASILPLIVSTNLAVAARVTELTDRAQAKIFEDYERVSGLQERGLLGQELAESVSKLHGQVGSFKKQVDSGTLRIGAIAEIQNSVLGLVQRIGLGAGAAAAEAGRHFGPDVTAAVESILVTSSELELLGATLEAVVASFRGPQPAARHEVGSSSKGLLVPPSARELEALDRLAGDHAGDVDLERFLVAAFCLRLRLGQLGEQLQSSVDEADTGVREAMRRNADACLRLGDLYLRRFDHFLDFASFLEEGRAVGRHGGDGVRNSKMRLMRVYSELWLAVRES